MGLSLYEALAGGLGNEQQYQSQDPYLMGGLSILKSPTPAPRTNSEAILLPLLQGLAGGAMMGYGQSNANNTAYADYKASPLLAQLAGQQNIGPVANGALYANELLHDYSSPTAPEGWTPKIGQQDLGLAALTMQAQQEDAQKKRQAQEELKAKVDLALNPEIRQAKIDDTIATEAGKAGVTAAKPVGLPASMVGTLAEQKAIVDEAQSLGTVLKNSGQSWGSLRASEAFTGLDDSGISLRIADLADRVLRSRSGAAAPVVEQNKLKKIIAGDKSVSPQQAGELILKFADRERANAKSQIDLVTTLGGAAGIAKAFEAPAAPPTPPPGYRLTGNRNANGDWGMVPIR